jgi:MFS family permease
VTAGEAARGGGRQRFGGLLRQRNFRLFWIGETVNQLGSAMALIGVPLLAVLFLHATTLEVAGLAAAAYLPWLVIGLPAGAWVDRLPPRPVMISCDAVSAALYASVPIAYATGVLTIGQLFAVQLLAGAAAVVFGTAYQVNLPSLVTTGELAEGNAKLQASASAAALGGRGLSGVVTQVVGPTAALIFNAASFLVSAACLLAIRAPEPRPALPRQVSTLRRDVADGMALVTGDPYLRALTLFGGVANLALDAFAALVVVFLVRVVGLAAGPTGLLTALPGLGGLLAALAARPVIAKIGSGRALLLATLGALPFALLIPLAGHGLRLVFYAAGVLVAATGVTMGNIILVTFRQVYCPSYMLGRVTATSPATGTCPPHQSRLPRPHNRSPRLGRSRIRAADPERKRARPADLASGPVHTLRIGQREGGDPLKPDLERYLQFHPRKMRTEAAMDAKAERRVPVYLAADDHFGWPVELGRIAVGRRERQQDPVICLHVHATEVQVLLHQPGHGDRSVGTQELLYRDRQQFRLRD